MISISKIKNFKNRVVYRLIEKMSSFNGKNTNASYRVKKHIIQDYSMLLRSLMSSLAIIPVLILWTVVEVRSI